MPYCGALLSGPKKEPKVPSYTLMLGNWKKLVGVSEEGEEEVGK